MFRAVLLSSTLVVTGCASSGPHVAGAAPPPRGCAATILSTARGPGKSWWAEQRWRFASDDAARAAYAQLLTDSPSPWPDWFQPPETVLPPGTRLQMALGAGQPVDRPGGFATFDGIGRVRDVRTSLAVKQAWKPKIDRVAVYQVTQPLKVRIGPVGPQVDTTTCRLLPGRWSQAEMLVAPPERMRYLSVVEVRPIR